MIMHCYNRLYEGQVLINGADTITGYNAARALHNSGLVVYGHAESKNSIYSKSRLWKKVFFCEFNHKSLKIISEEIQSENNARGMKPVLLLSQDSAVEYVSECRDDLARHYLFLLPEHTVVSNLMDKTKFHLWAVGNDVLVPKSKIVKNSDDLKRAFDNLDYPVVIKPLVRTKKWDSRFANDKLIYIASEKYINTIPDDIFKLSDNFVVQEWIPGGDENVYFVLAHIDEKNNCIGMAGRKLLQWPVLSGSTASCVSVDNQTLTDLGVEILRRAGLKGLGSIEFKRHDENNRYYVIEPTVGRNDYQSYIAIASNINLSLYYVLNCLEYSYVADLSHSDAMWIDEINSIRSLFASYSWKKSLTELCSPLKYKIRFANMALIDLATFIRLIFWLVINKVKHGYEKRIKNFIKPENVR